jgi:hypothetical protein
MKMEEPNQETTKEPTKEQVTRRAYQLWEQAGKPEGADEEQKTFLE